MWKGKKEIREREERKKQEEGEHGKEAKARKKREEMAEENIAAKYTLSNSIIHNSTQSIFIDHLLGKDMEDRADKIKRL